MRNLLIAVLLLFTCRPVFSQINDNSSFFNGTYDRAHILNNKIQTVTVNMYSHDSAYARWVHVFDSAGRLISMSRYARSGNLAQVFNLTYNSYGDLAVRESINYETGRTDTVVFNKRYNKSRLIKDSAAFMPVNYQYEYNSRGDVTKIIARDNVWGQSGRVIQNTYREDGRLTRIKEIKFQSPLYDSVVFSDRKFIYNKKGRLKQERESADPVKYGLGNTGSATYKYNKKGELTEIRRSRGRSCKMLYDDKGLMTTIQMILKVDSDKVEMYDTFTYEVY